MSPVKKLWTLAALLALIGVANLFAFRYKVSIYKDRIVRYDRWTNKGSAAGVGGKAWLPIPNDQIPDDGFIPDDEHR